MKQQHSEKSKNSKMNQKERRMASHVEESEKDQGRDEKRASAIGWATAQKHANKREEGREASSGKHASKKGKSAHKKTLH
ncbi:hypothetical protein BDW_03030 [Bdellovibrio bacteriovorus W]|nr:hypothetical protein BDW_03030 [Bdellovibrio bacteriovorus W]